MNDLLLFLWKWKLVSTAALSSRYFSDLKPHSAYKRLLHLTDKGLITASCDQLGRSYYWSLSKKGFEFIKPQLTSLREIGFRSEYPTHDHLVSAIHLGEDLFMNARALETFSEQELRRVDFDFFPKWVPVSNQHRPDGYWRVTENNKYKTLALEVELTMKRECDYHGVAKFYARHDFIEQVIWFCPCLSFAKKLSGVLCEHQDIPRTQHQFFLVDDFSKQGWDADSKFGAHAGTSLRRFLGKPTGNGREQFPHRLLMDLRKRRTKFEEYSKVMNTVKP